MCLLGFLGPRVLISCLASGKVKVFFQGGRPLYGVWGKRCSLGSLYSVWPLESLGPVCWGWGSPYPTRAKVELKSASEVVGWVIDPKGGGAVWGS